ncbi:MAG: flippase-like domain-containing protein [Firmicutes bacterium]|nr:flippase-like domain-containing protein [Bacillota bacterium]
MVKWLDKNKKGIANFLLLAVIIGITYYLLLRGKDIDKVIEAIKQADTVYVWLGIASMFIFIALEAVIIKYLMKNLGEDVKFLSCLKYSMIGFFFSNVTPSASGGQPMQVVYMKRDGIDVSYSSLILLIITVFYKFVIVLMGVLLLLFQYDFLTAHLEDSSMRYLFYFGIGANIIVILGFFIIIFMKKTTKVLVGLTLKLIMKLKMIKNKDEVKRKVITSLARYQRGAEYYKKNKGVLFNVFWITILQRCAMFVVTYFIYKGFGLSEYNVFQIIMLQCMIAITVDILPFPGGAGISESCFMSIFEKLFGEYLILPAIMMFRGITYYLYLIISGAVLCYAQIFSNKDAEELG